MLTSELLGWENMGWNPTGECTMLSTIEAEDDKSLAVDGG
jgi:hypothetical protein